jgi:choline-sulfatase/uncharacterized sulfatase
MSDQHNANCMGYRNHPNVRTPNLDKLAARGIDFPRAFANNPVCSPSRLCYMTGQYMHTHRMFGNDHSEFSGAFPDHMAIQFRRHGYQTGLFGKAHLTRALVDEGFERYRYTDMADAERGDPTTCHYFKYLDDLGLADYYEEGTPKPGQQYTMDGSQPAKLPYEHSIEHYTGEETIRFLQERDDTRPFFVQMSFQRPHAPIAPAVEHFDLYDPADIVLPDSAVDFLEHGFPGRPEFMDRKIRGGMNYPLADRNPERLKRVLASYYALITVIDQEIGRVMQTLEEIGEADNTIVIYCADHGDFAGEHGLFHKNFGIYDSIHRIPFLLHWPDGPQGAVCDSFVETVDLYPTLCELCRVPLPNGRDGVSLVPAAMGQAGGKEQAYCEWEWLDKKVAAIRTRDYRLVYYNGEIVGELYDHRSDPYEMRNVWGEPEYRETRLALTERLLNFVLNYQVRTSKKDDEMSNTRDRYSPVKLLHKRGKYWSRLKRAYEEKVKWPPSEGE